MEHDVTHLTDSQKASLAKAAKGEIIPAVHFTRLRDAGLVESCGPSGLRGYSNAKLTDAGRAALA